MTEPSISTPATQSVLAQPVPISALLSLWVNAWCVGDVSGDSLADAMTTVGANRIVGARPPKSELSGPTGLITGLAELGISPANRQLPAMRVSLPTAGDPRGLPGPKDLNIAALDAGQVAIVDQLNVALVPSTGDNPTVVMWTAYQTALDVPPTVAVRPEEAPTAVRAALHSAMASLAELDLATSSMTVRNQMRALSRALERTPLPPALAGQDRHTIHTAATVIAICEFALADNPNQPTATLERERRRVLVELSATARHSLAATCSAR
ncbi:MAG: hypothetical protein HQ526_06125 [Actinobacteria bacterium]|nr:hypothetical protein [Actinomycetota bacterium]